MNTKNVILLNNKTIWRKKSEHPFTINMGSFDGAESCELIELHLLSKINTKYRVITDCIEAMDFAPLMHLLKQ